jgi:hypothetical protein
MTPEWSTHMTFNPDDPKLKKAQDEELLRLIKEGRKKFPLEAPAPTPREGVCVVCKGKVTETYSKVYDPRTGPLIIGPGSRSQYHWQTSGLSCASCGIKYAKLPALDGNPSDG